MRMKMFDAVRAAARWVQRILAVHLSLSALYGLRTQKK